MATNKQTLFRIITLLALCLSITVMATAQDTQDTNEELDEFVFDPFFAFSQSAVDGTLTEQEDGNYLLTLNGVAEYSPWMASPLAYGNMPTLDLERGIRRTTRGTLTIGTLTLELTLMNVDFDTETNHMMQYTVTVDYMTGPDVTDKTPVPTEFAGATLFIPVGAEFLQALADAQTGMRAVDMGEGSAMDCSRVANILEILSVRDDFDLAPDYQAYFDENCADM